MKNAAFGCSIGEDGYLLILPKGINYSGVMKGINPIAAVIVLIVIAVGVISFSQVYFQKTSVIPVQAQGDVTATQQIIYRIRIESLSRPNAEVTFRNFGTSTISSSIIQVYVAGKPAGCSPAIPTSISPNQQVKCKFSQDQCPQGTPVKLTWPGGSDEEIC
jgi:hypothetical protein